MDGFTTLIVLLCLTGIVAVVGASGYLNQAQQEFQSRLRNAALGRARTLLAGALAVWGVAALLTAFATPEMATAAAKNPPPAPPPQYAALQLRIDQDINFTGR